MPPTGHHQNSMFQRALLWITALPLRNSRRHRQQQMGLLQYMYLVRAYLAGVP